MRRPCLEFAIGFVSCMACNAIAQHPLTDNVAAIATGGNPATMIAWGDAEPLVVAPDGRVFAAASRLGNGRVVALGHGAYTSTDKADAEIFVANAVAWLAGVTRGPIRVHGLHDVVANELEARGLAFERVAANRKQLDLKSVDVVIGSPQAFAKAGRIDELRRWIRGGGGMLVTETAWGTLQLNRDLTLDTLAANTLLEPAGIRFTGQASSAFGDGGYPVDPSLQAPANASYALGVLTGEHEGDAAFAARVLGGAFGNVPLDAAIIREAEAVRERHAQDLDRAYRAMASTALRPGNEPLARALIDLDARKAMELPAERIRAHPSSVAFPGPVGEQRAGIVRLKIDATIPGWHTTGLYAPPGELVTLRVAHGGHELGAHVQIGAWRDPHNHPKRVRLKHALRRYPLDSNSIRVASAIGGPIYLDVPGGAGDKLADATLQIEIRGAARAPHYEHGQTDLQQWRDTIRHYDVPWAELESDELVLTIPAEAVRDLDRPDLVMDHWDRVHGAMQSLEPRTDNHWADRPYRYVADDSVSWGYMYCPANGPIVIPTSAARAMVELENFDAEGPNKLWGHYHEMGHAHQNRLWTDSATGEVTVNIFTVYALHTINGYPLDADVMRTTPENAWNTYEKHRGSGKAFEAVGGAFPRLQFYALLWHEFGFEAFHEAFDSIRAMPKLDQPKNQAEERNVFMVHMSKAVDRDLSGYFDAWGIEVLDEYRAQVEEFAPWLPEAP